MLWDVFCRVIDNHGDLGVCWRLATHLAGLGHGVRLWVDQAQDLQWMAPQGHAGVQVLPWPLDPRIPWPPPEDPLRPTMGQDGQAIWPDNTHSDTKAPKSASTIHGVIEAFGCELPQAVQAAMAAEPTAPVWINLEYLSAEPHVARLHGLPSPVLSGPARGLQKWFFYPGFTPHTGGLLHPAPPPNRRSTQPPQPAPGADPAHTSSSSAKQAHAALGSAVSPSPPAVTRSPTAKALRVLLFCYEPASLPTWLSAWADGPQPIDLSVCAGRASRAVQAWQAQRGPRGDGALCITHLPWVSQVEFDALLAGHDLNFVRGEDSLVRALWAGQAMVWQIYPQDDGVHQRKLAAFLHSLAAPSTLVQAHEAWNSEPAQAPLDLGWEVLHTWGDWVRGVRQQLLAQPDLAEQLSQFASTRAVPSRAQG